MWSVCVCVCVGVEGMFIVRALWNTTRRDIVGANVDRRGNTHALRYITAC